MITAWILYALLVGALAGSGALVLDRLLRAHRLPTRWVWAGSMGLSLFWPLGHVLWRHWPREAGIPPPPDPTRIAVLEPLTVQVTQESFLRTLDGPLVAFWAAASLILLLFFSLLVVRTRRMRRRWAGEEAGGHRVLFSQDMGPAVVGYVRPQIVLPAWCRELEDQTLKLILDHELEHLRAGDLRLMLTAGMIPILLPWHLPLWWQLRRLRMAVEADCDLRVVRRYPERIRPYLELLLRVGGRAPGMSALVAMLSEPEETLEQRIRIMTMPFPRKPWVRGVLLTVLGGVLVAVACWAPSPSEVRNQGGEQEAVVLPPDRQVELPPPGENVSTAPTFTPFTVGPDIKNREVVARALEEQYPPLLKDAGIGGTVKIWFFIDTSGNVQRLMVDESSGHQALDEAALQIGGLIEFTPAMNRDKAVAAWISLPITFSATSKDSPREPQAEEKASDSPAPPTDVGSRDIEATPTFTPYTVRPDIRNRAEVARALEEAYPPELRDAGTGGTAHVWFFIDEGGVVQRTQVNQSSGHPALDEAALKVAGKIQFTAALNKGEPVPVWISLPITFSVR